MTTALLPRAIYLSAQDLILDGNGFTAEPGKFSQGAKLYSLDEVLAMKGGILVAEGGMGKSTLLIQLNARVMAGGESKLLELILYKDEPAALTKEIEDSLTSWSTSKAERPFLILDGLDEAQNLSSTLIRLLPRIPGNVVLWIATRSVPEIKSIQAKRSDLATFSIAPLSENNIRTWCSSIGVDSSQFMTAIEQNGITSICAKPLGCQMVLKEYASSGAAGLTRSKIWESGMRRLCDENPSSSKQLSPSTFPLDEVYNCARWIALCSLFSGKSLCWIGEETHAPAGCLTTSDLYDASNGITKELLCETLARPAFSHLGDGRYRFSHASYVEYLAGRALEWIPSAQWNHLLLHKDAQIYPQYRQAAAWLATYNRGFLEQLAEREPEILLVSNEIMDVLTPKGVAESLLSRAPHISYRMRRSIRQDLFRLQHPALSEQLLAVLKNPASPEETIELAIDIAEACGCDGVAGELATRGLNSSLSFSLRIDAAAAVCRLGDSAARARLKALIALPKNLDPDDELLGYGLRACFPKHMTVEELLAALRPRQNPSLTGSYEVFLLTLIRDFVCTIEQAPACLEWAAVYSGNTRNGDALEQLAAKIVTHCWKWACHPEIAPRLSAVFARSYDGHSHPFAQRTYSYSQLTPMDPEHFAQDLPGRFSVLSCYLASRNKIEDIRSIPVFDYPLFTARDIQQIFVRLEDSRWTQLELGWVTCLLAIINQIELAQYRPEVDRVHARFPEIIASASDLEKTFENSRARSVDMWKGIERERALKEAEIESRDKQRQERVLRALRNPQTHPSQFAGICTEMQRSISDGYIDLTKSNMWQGFESSDRKCLLDLAYRYLSEVNYQRTPPGTSVLQPASALVLLQSQDSQAFLAIGKDTWSKWAFEILKMIYSEMDGLMDHVLDRMMLVLGDEVLNPLYDVLIQEAGTGHTLVLRLWGSRLTDDLAQKLIDRLHGDPDRKPYDIAITAFEDLGVPKSLPQIVSNNIAFPWVTPPSSSLNATIFAALRLDPGLWLSRIIDAFIAFPAWGFQWLEAAVIEDDDAMQAALVACPPKLVGSLYILINQKYPGPAPSHDGVYSPGLTDRLHELKSFLINQLVRSGQSGSSDSLREIERAFPQDTWIKNCIIDAETNEREIDAKGLACDDLKKLRAQGNSMAMVVRNGSELQEALSRSLARYQVYLQGDQPRVTDLWDRKPQILPRNENYVSSHLVSFLKKDLNRGTVINREVEIREKEYPEGEPGSRTDIWIQTVDRSGKILTLCIEVKCNWNKEAKSAMEDQLIKKYMSGGTASVGILLVAWFSCDGWEKSDYRRVGSTSLWKSIDECRADLDAQAKKLSTNEKRLSVAVIDCGMK